MDEYLTTEEVAAIRRRQPDSVRQERIRGQGPPYVRDGRRILYPRSALEQWMAARLITPEQPTTRNRWKQADAASGL